MDNLKSIFKNKILNQEEVPSGHETRFMEKLDEEFPTDSKIKKWIMPAISYAIAASIGIVLFLSILDNDKSIQNETPIILVSENAENIEAEVYLQNQVESRMETIQELDKKGKHTAELIIDIVEFDNSLNRLRTDLNEAPGDQRIVEAVLNTYIMKIEALDNIVYILQKIS